jgi:hypothetical protein
MLLLFSLYKKLYTKELLLVVYLFPRLYFSFNNFITPRLREVWLQRNFVVSK